MAFPSSNNFSVSRTLEAIQNLASGIRNQSLGMMSGSKSGEQLLTYLEGLREAKALFDQWKTAPGLAQYAKDQFDDQAFDIVAEFNTMLAALQDVLDDIVTTFPASGGYIQREQLDAQGNITDRSFTSGQLTAMRVKIQAFIDTID